MNDESESGVRDQKPLLSVVVPVYNEAEGLEPFIARLLPVVRQPCERLGGHFEIIFVNDGSTDGTLEALHRHRERHAEIKIIDLSRNFGKDTALSAGLDFASGNAVVPIDVDLQDPPELIPELVAKWLEGFDVVYATRRTRGSDSPVKRLTARWFYRLYNRVASVHIPHDTGDFRLMDRRIVDIIRQMPERNRFMKGLFAWVGFRQTGVPYERACRSAGKSKWRYWHLWNFAIDGITASTTLPLRIWTYLGGLVAMAAFLYGSFLILHTLLSGVDVPGYASIMVAVLFIGGLVLIGLGIQGEYIGRIFGETKARPLYLVQNAVGFERKEGIQDRWTVSHTPEWRTSNTGTGGS